MRLRRRRRVYVDDLPPTHDVRFAVLFLLGLVALFGSLYAVGYYVAGDKLPSGTTVAGVDIGGMNRDEARTALQAELAPRLERSITLETPRRTFTLYPQSAGLVFDIDATLDDGLGGSRWDPRHMVHVITGGDEIDPVIDVDAAELDAALDRVAGRVEQRARDSSVTFGRTQPQIQYGQPGRAIDSTLTRERLVRALLRDQDTARLALLTVDPEVTATEASDFVAQVGRLAMSGAVTLHVDGTQVRLPRRRFGPALRTTLSGGGLALDVDAGQLYARSRPLLATLPDQPVDASVVIRAGRPVVVPSRAGVVVPEGAWARAVLRAVQRADAERRAAVPTRPTDPGFTTLEARRLHITSLMSRATVTAPDTVPQTVLQEAGGQLDGSLVGPGDMLSFVSRVRSSGHPAAVSWLAGATYEAAFTGGLDIVERTPRRTYDDRFPAGLDARVAPPAVDLILRNPTRGGILVVVSAVPSSGGSTVLTVELWGVDTGWQVDVTASARSSVVPPGLQQGAAPSCTPRAGVAGFDVDVSRVFLRDGQPRRTDTAHSHYEPLDQVVCDEG